MAIRFSVIAAPRSSVGHPRTLAPYGEIGSTRTPIAKISVSLKKALDRLKRSGIHFVN